MKREERYKLVHRFIENALREAKERGCDSAGGYAYATGCLSSLLQEALGSLPSDHIVLKLLKEK